MQKRKMQLNIAGSVTRLFLHSKLTLLIILSSILFGVFALSMTPRTYNPEVVVPVVALQVSRPGSSANEILEQVIRPLEALMASMPGVDHTYGMALDDAGMTTVRFNVGENEEESLVKVYNQINSNLDKMPPGTSMPLVQSISLYDVPLLTITLSAKDMDKQNLRDVALKLKEQLRSVPNVGKSSLSGSRPRSLKVWLNPEKLAHYGITISQIKQAISHNNSAGTAGAIETADSAITIKVDGRLMDIAATRKIMVGLHQGKAVLLGDVAKLEIGARNENIASYIGGKAFKAPETAVTISLARKKGSNGVTVARDIIEKLNQLRPTLIPKQVHVTVTRNYGVDANEAVNTLTEHLAIAIVAVSLILMVFLGWREASIVIISIPIILFIVLGIGWLYGQTINRITLFAFILSLGLLVDDSIVVIENIHRHMVHFGQRNFSRLIVQAANEIGKPTIVATFTVILALIPMAFVGGMMGPFMGPIPFNAPMAMLVSLVIAFSVVPYLAYRGLRRKSLNILASAETHKAELNRLQRFYEMTFNILLNSKKIRHGFYLTIVALLFLSLLQPAWQFIRPSGTNGPLSLMGVGLKMLPDDNVSTLLLELNLAPGRVVSQTQAIAKEVTGILETNPNVTDYQVFLGEAAPADFAAMVRGDAYQSGEHYAQIRVNLTNKKDRHIGSHEIAKQISKDLMPIQSRHPDANIKLFETPPGPPVRSQMEAGVYGPDYQEQRQLAQSITHTILPNIYGLINRDNSVTKDAFEYKLNIDRMAAQKSALAVAQIQQEIGTLFAGDAAGSLHNMTAKEPELIQLRLSKQQRRNKDTLSQLSLLNQFAVPVPLNTLSTLDYQKRNKPIMTRDQHPVVYIGGETLSSSPVYAMASISQQVAKLKTSKGSIEVGNLGFTPQSPSANQRFQLFWLGEMRLTLDVFRDLGSAFIVAIALIYILLVGFYRSFFIPLIIMGAIPLTIIGIFPGHWLLSQPFTATSMIGVIALAGIVVRNSLLLIDFILERQKSGYDLTSAVMESGVARITPILLTALAIILGSAIMISDPVFGGLAISLIFGALASTILTLYLIPLIYHSWRRRSH